MALLERYSHSGRIWNQRQFRKLDKGVWEFKRGQCRLLCYRDGSTIALTHGFLKKSAKCPRREIDRAVRIASEDKSRT
ncbi:MAG: type II toxin-antitoxin system RelE/ParE family toxin [Phycisphaerae bacterium]